MRRKSRFRGVYECGKRWKAQLQSGGVQFYLGTFDSEHDAAVAYDVKAKEEKGDKAQTNFDEAGNETQICQIRPSISALEDRKSNSYDDLSDSSDFQQIKKIKKSINDVSACDSSELSVSVLGQVDDRRPANQLPMMWDRLCQITNRLQLAQAAHGKLTELQKKGADENKQALIISLTDELALLAIVKGQLEEAIAAAISLGFQDGQNDDELVELSEHVRVTTPGRMFAFESLSYPPNSNVNVNVNSYLNPCPNPISATTMTYPRGPYGGNVSMMSSGEGMSLGCTVQSTSTSTAMSLSNKNESKESVLSSSTTYSSQQSSLHKNITEATCTSSLSLSSDSGKEEYENSDLVGLLQDLLSPLPPDVLTPLRSTRNDRDHFHHMQGGSGGQGQFLHSQSQSTSSSKPRRPLIFTFPDTSGVSRPDPSTGSG
eukprot:gene822-1599_t